MNPDDTPGTESAARNRAGDDATARNDHRTERGEADHGATMATTLTDHPALTTMPPDGETEVVGRLREASNQTFLLRIASHNTSADPRPQAALAPERRQQLRPPAGVFQGIYKPVAGERSLWDFPEHTLGFREVAAYQVSRLGGFDVVPVTTMVEGPFGPGSLQIWVESDDREVDQLIDLIPSSTVPETGWFDVMQGLDPEDRPVSLIHADDERLRRMALLDVLINNADRKGGHILVNGGRVFGVDHGICFHSEDKLRTLLWGWAGQALTERELARIQAVQDQAIEVLDRLLDPDEIEALLLRSEQLLRSGRFPHPAGAWHDIPWPPF